MPDIATDVLSLLDAMLGQAGKQREALRRLDTRVLLDLAAQSQVLVARLNSLLKAVDAKTLGSNEWSQVRARAAQVKALGAVNATVAARSLDVVSALRGHSPSQRQPEPMAPAFVSERA